MNITKITVLAPRDGTDIKVPLTIVSTQPASRNAEPPAKITNAAYEIAEMSNANKVPFGIELPGSFRSPEIFAPACKPVTEMIKCIY